MKLVHVHALVSTDHEDNTSIQWSLSAKRNSKETKSSSTEAASEKEREAMDEEEQRYRPQEAISIASF